MQGYWKSWTNPLEAEDLCNVEHGLSEPSKHSGNYVESVAVVGVSANITALTVRSTQRTLSLLTPPAMSHLMSDPHAGCDCMDLISLRDIELGFGGDALLEGVSLRVESGERVCLFGRNGSGKTTLLKLVAGELQPDGGEIVRYPAIRIAGLQQSVPQSLSGSTRAVVAGGLGELGALIETHLRLSTGAGQGGDLEALDAAHQRIDAAGAWDVEQRIERTLTRLALDPEARFEALSGGLAPIRIALRSMETDSVPQTRAV